MKGMTRKKKKFQRIRRRLLLLQWKSLERRMTTLHRTVVHPRHRRLPRRLPQRIVVAAAIATAAVPIPMMTTMTRRNLPLSKDKLPTTAMMRRKRRKRMTVTTTSSHHPPPPTTTPTTTNSSPRKMYSPKFKRRRRNERNKRNINEIPITSTTITTPTMVMMTMGTTSSNAIMPSPTKVGDSRVRIRVRRIIESFNGGINVASLGR
mmetsp:Transcript_1415/g.2703  ORF Transcript_1415/g.2703 Transcript_1415/m.2703 type:complete len:206 (+) Transcript_1415:615-1232(+)